MASLRCLAASTAISRRSLTLGWPVNSEKSEGRNVISNAASGFVRTSEITRSAMNHTMRDGRAGDKGEMWGSRKWQSTKRQTPSSREAPSIKLQREGTGGSCRKEGEALSKEKVALCRDATA